MGWKIFDKAANYQPCVYFGGRTEKTVVGLIGSRRHVIGHNPAPLSNNGNESAYYSDDEIIQPIFEAIIIQNKRKRDKPTNWLHELYYQSLDQSNVATHTLEFLAKRLYYRSPDKVDDSRKILIETPIYVALNA
jgi:hypothetical protein